MSGNGKALTAMQLAFVEHYLTLGEGKAAAIKAGYSETSAKVTACRMLGLAHVQAAIERRRGKLRDMAFDAGVSPEAVIQEYRRLGFSSLTDVVTWDPDGRPSIKPSDEIPREVAVAVRKIKFKRRELLNKDGDVVAIDTENELEMHPKQAALDGLAKHLDLFGEREKDGGDRPNLVLTNIMVMQGTDG